MQPGRDGRVAAISARGAIGGHECVLHGVGGVVGVAERAQRNAPQPVLMTADDVTERVRVAGNVPGEQVAILRRLVVPSAEFRWAHHSPCRSRVRAEPG